MQTPKAFAAGVLALGMCGCQSLAMAALKSLDEKPYSFPVAAQELARIPSPGESLAPPESSVAPTAAPAVAPQIAEAAPEPARTDIRGAGDGSMKVDRVIITAAKPVPHKVPDFSREQMASMVCSVRSTNNPKSDAEALSKTMRAYEATVIAHDRRTAFEAGQGKRKEADDAELKRQEAVRAVMGSGFVFDLFNGRETKKDLPQPAQGGVVLQNVDLFTFKENGLDVMAVSGMVRNTSAANAELSPLTLEALDQWEFILAGQTSLLPFEQLAPGEARLFEMRFLNPPDTANEVYVHFAPPFEYRARRDCDFFDPSTASLETMRRPDSAETAITPVHTAAELNELTRIYRSEAESSWKCRKGKDSELPKGGLQFAAEGSGERREGFSISLGLGKPNMELACAPAAKRVRWREMFALAEATDEAWGAMRAAEVAHRRLAAGLATQADADAADVAQKRAYGAFRSLGKKALARVGGSAPDIAVEITKSSYGHEQLKGFHVEFSGVLRNTGSEPRQVDALMLALVDRLEQPMLSITIDSDTTLAPGETKEFTHRVSLREPIRRRSPEQTPAWQVRVGAIGH